MGKTDEALERWRIFRETHGLTVRLQQEELFEGLLRGLDKGEPVFGAGPCGCGKSAVVVPLSAFTRGGGRVVHSSFTKSQQAQVTAFGAGLVQAGVFTRVVELRGRSEYLCAVRRSWNGLPTLECEGPGLRSDLPAMSDEEWAQSRSDAEAGCGTECGDLDYANRARVTALAAGSLVTINHSVLAFDVMVGGAILGLDENDVLVVDEAHQAPDAFRSALGASLTETRLRRLRRLAVDQLGHDVGEGGIRSLVNFLSAFDVEEHRREAGEAFMYVPSWTDSLTEVQLWVRDLIRDVKGFGADDPSAKRVLSSAMQVMRDLYTLRDALDPDADVSVAWVEQGLGGRNRLEVRPLDVSDFARRVLETPAAAVAVSATVKWVVDDLGGGTLVEVGSPFDEARNRVGVVSRNGERGKVDEQQRLAEMVRVVKRNRGKGALVLASTNRVRVGARWVSQMDLAEEALTAAGFRVGVQRSTADVPALVAALKDSSLDVVVGTASMREGIDVPGDRLGVVVLFGLGWPYMGDPLLRARMDRAGERQKWKLLTPMMESNTVQAVGRLLRTPEDSGFVVLLDGRPSAVKHFRRLIEPSVVGAVIA